MPSVRGRTRTATIVLLVGSGTVGAALTGVVAWLALQLVGGLAADALDIGTVVGSEAFVVAVVASGLVFDLVGMGTGRMKPPAVGRQVPQEWSRLLPPPVVAVLYGARLGVGPLTILSTWSWWSATLISALLGLGPAVAVGAMFGSVRLVVMVVVSIVAGGPGQARHYLRLRSRQRSSRLTLTGLGFVALTMLVLAGCGGGRSTDGDGGPLQHLPVSTTMTASATNAVGPVSATRSPSPDRGQPEESAPPDLTATAPATVPTQLEDFVRVAQLDPESGTVSPAQSPAPEALAEALLATVPGFNRIAEPAADRFLDLAAAAALQPDPTEEVALLETRGYQGGWTRAFRNPGNDVVVASVYHFDNDAQAEFYLEDGLITIGGYGGRFFDVDGLPAVRGFTQAFQDGDEPLVSLGAAFHTGQRWYLVYFVGSPETVTPDVLIPTVIAQQEAAEAALLATPS